MVQETNLKPTYTQMAWQVAVLLGHLQAEMTQIWEHVCVHARPLVCLLQLECMQGHFRGF